MTNCYKQLNWQWQIITYSIVKNLKKKKKKKKKNKTKVCKKYEEKMCS